MKGSVMFVTKIVKIGPALYRVRAYTDGRFSRHWTQTVKGSLWDAKQRASKNGALYACLNATPNGAPSRGRMEKIAIHYKEDQ